MIVVLQKDLLGHKAGDTLDILDDVVAEIYIKQGAAKPAPKDAISTAVDTAVEAISGRVEHALKLALDQLAITQTKSLKNQIPEIFGAGPRSDPEKTFGKFLLAIRQGDRKTIEEVFGSEWEPWTKTAMVGTTGANGGFMVPTEHYDGLMMYAIEASIMRKYAYIIPQNAKETEVPCLDVVTAPTAGNNAMLGGVVFNWTEDSATETETEPNLKMCRLINYELTGYSYLSNSLLEDTGGALETIIKMIFGTGIGWTEDYAFFRGNGAGKPLGVVAWNGLISVTRSGASAFALADYAGMLARLIPGSNRKRCFWVFSPTASAKLYALVATSTMFARDFQTNPTGLELGGLPVHVSDKLPGLNTAGDILLCSGEGYLIGDRRKVSIAFSDGPRFTNNQTTWRVNHRVAGRPWATDKTTLPDATNTVGPFIALAAG